MPNDKLVNRENLKAFREKLDEKYVIEGEYSPTTSVGEADVANNLTPYSDESGDSQDQPFILQGTGTGNGTEIVTTGDYAQIKGKLGNSVVRNQLVQNNNFASDTNWTLNDSGSASKSIANNTLTITSLRASQPVVQYGVQQNNNILNTHKYLISISCKGTFVSANQRSVYVYFNDLYTLIGYSTSSKKLFNTIITATTNASVVKLSANLAEVGDIVDFNYFNITDLTQWFGSNSLIPQDLLDNPSNASRYGITSDLAYDTGTLVNSDGRYLETSGRNLFDKATAISGKNIDSDTGNLVDNANTTVSDFILIPSNKPIHFRNIYPASYNYGVFWFDVNKTYIKCESVSQGTGVKTAPSNAVFVRTVVSNSKVNDCDVSLYYTPEEGGEGYSEHYDYEEPTVVDTGNEVLRSAGSVRDVKLPSGEITRKVGTYTFTGNESWTLTTNSAYTTIDDLGGKSQGKAITNTPYSANLGNNGNAVVVSIDVNIYDTQAKVRDYMSGKTLYFELATPTTEQGTPFPQNIKINDYGTMGWKDTNNAYVNIPQACDIFYPINYKGFLDDVYARTGGDASDIVVQSELSEYVKQVDLSSEITDSAGLTYNVKKAYKIGNMLFITIRAKNETGSTINANSNLFKLSNYSSSFAMSFSAIKYHDGTNTTEKLGLSTSGNFTLDAILANEDFVFINISYAIG